MGGYLSSYYRGSVDGDGFVPFSGRRKRSAEAEPCEDSSVLSESDDMQTPKRKKMKTTSEYIYQTLFINGDNSDVSIIALGKEWRLHKVYLCQCRYFKSMFCGSWKESTQSVIKMAIPDKNIDEEALSVAFGSLYREDVSVRPAKVVGVLAAAALLQLDGLQQQAAEIMTETVRASTVSSYLYAAWDYGQVDVARKCVTWLELNLVRSSRNTELLRSISAELMEQLVLSSNLVVMQVEMDIYSMLKKWLFLCLTPSWKGSSTQLVSDVDRFYKERLKSTLPSRGSVDHIDMPPVKTDAGSWELSCPAFLTTPQGEMYIPVFRSLRFQHIINDAASVDVVLTDKIVPEEWLLPYFKCQWLHMIRIEQGKDKGPRETDSEESDQHRPYDSTSETFNKQAFRCGRILPRDAEYCWRWTGFQYGVDFLVTYSNKLIVFKRNTLSQNCLGSVSMQAKRHLLYRLSVFTLDDRGNASYTNSSGLKSLVLGKDEDFVAMTIDRGVVFPLHVSLSLLTYSPDPKLCVTLPPTPRLGLKAGDHSSRRGHADIDDSTGRPEGIWNDAFGNPDDESTLTSPEYNVIPVELDTP